MADSAISALTGVSSIDGTQEYAVNDSGTTKKATGTQQAAYGETRLQQGVLCSNSGTTTCTTGTWTSLAFDTEVWKVGESAIHSTVSNNSRLTAQITGEYVVGGEVHWVAVAAAFAVAARVIKNGSTELWRVQYPAVNSGSVNTIIALPAGLIQLSATDYVEFEAWHNRGSNLDVATGYTRFGMYLIGR
jgi:hypothetical protein